MSVETDKALSKQEHESMMKKVLKVGAISGLAVLGGSRLARRFIARNIPYEQSASYYRGGLAAIASPIKKNIQSSSYLSKTMGPGYVTFKAFQGKPLIKLARDLRIANRKQKLKRLDDDFFFNHNVSIKKLKDRERISKELRKDLRIEQEFRRSEIPYSKAVSNPLTGTQKTIDATKYGHSLIKPNDFTSLSKAKAIDGKTPLANIYDLKQNKNMNVLELLDPAHRTELKRIISSDPRFNFWKWGLSAGLKPHQIMKPTKKLIEQAGMTVKSIKLPKNRKPENFMDGFKYWIDDKRNVNVSFIPSKIEYRPYRPAYNSLVENIGDKTLGGFTTNAKFARRTPHIQGIEKFVGTTKKLYSGNPTSVEVFDKTDFTGNVVGKLLNPIIRNTIVYGRII